MTHTRQNTCDHYIDVKMTTVASEITSLTVVYSTVYSDADQRKHHSSASLAFMWGIHRDRWISHTKGQLRRKCFHLMTSSCNHFTCSTLLNKQLCMMMMMKMMMMVVMVVVMFGDGDLHHHHNLYLFIYSLLYIYSLFHHHHHNHHLWPSMAVKSPDKHKCPSVTRATKCKKNRHTLQYNNMITNVRWKLAYRPKL